MKKRAFFAIALTITLVISGCSSSDSKDNTKDTANVMEEQTEDKTSDDGEVSTETTAMNNSDLFSDRDFEIEYDAEKSAVITLSGNTASCSSDAVQISGSTVTITDEGTYILSGTLDDGMIIVDSEKTDKTQLVLNGVTIHSETCASIYIKQSDKVFITTAKGTVNTLSNGGSFTAIDDNNIDSVIFSKEDLTLNGAGTLVVTSPGGHGIVSKDSLRITCGVYDINCASHAITGKDDACIADGEFTIVSGKDGIHAENSEDTSLGFVYIQNGSFDISAEGDGVSASSYMQIENGSFNIVAGGGSVNGSSQSSDSWGDFMGGGRHSMGQPGGGNMQTSPSSQSTAQSEEDSTSMKGLKAEVNVLINGGNYVIDSADDAVHSNTSVTINGGSFEIASGDDAFHAEDTLLITDGTMNITESYEGLEGLHVNVSGGNITLIASDDGLNAAGGTDSSGMGGRDAGFGGGMGGGYSASSSGSITISGGVLHITASGDGIDANGTLDITDGHITVCGPTQGDTATLDYDTRATITGGTFIGTGASSMAQTFSDSEQGVLAVSVGSQAAGTKIVVEDSKGNEVFTYTPELSFAVMIFSSPELVSGENYTITVGSISGQITAN